MTTCHTCGATDALMYIVYASTRRAFCNFCELRNLKQRERNAVTIEIAPKAVRR